MQKKYYDLIAACVIMYQRVHCRNSQEFFYWISLYVVIKARFGGKVLLYREI